EKRWGPEPCSAIFRDLQGVVWFGGEDNGLARYDGKSFIRFVREDGLSDNTVNSILGTTDGALWVSTARGLSRYDARSFTLFGARDGLPREIRLTKAFSDGTFWIVSGSTPGGDTICHVDGGGVVLTNYTARNGLPGQYVSGVAEAAGSVAWIAGP